MVTMFSDGNVKNFAAPFFAMATDFDIFTRQTLALTKKNLIIAVVRHPLSTTFRALVLPIAFLILLLNIKHLIGQNNGYGVGSPVPVQSLQTAISGSQKLVFVQPPGLGQDVVTVVDAISRPLRPTKQLVYLTNETELPTTCRQNLHGTSGCFAAIVFNDSPLTSGKKGEWTYTIHADNHFNGFSFHVNSHSNDEDRVYLPLQVAIENAITNSTIVPNHYMFTSRTQADEDALQRERYQRLVISTYGIAFFITLMSPVYHSVGMMTTERESGMADLIDSMGGGPASRIISYVLAFDIIYTPCWIVFGVLFWHELFATSSVLISLFWQIFAGWSITSASIFSSTFFKRAQLSGLYSVIGFLVFGVCGQLMDYGKPRTATVAIMSLLFPSMNYAFMIGYMCRYEQQALPTNLLRAASPTFDEASTSRLAGIILWAFLLLQTVLYPILAIFIEKLIHGSKSRDRVIGHGTSTHESSVIVETSALCKTYPPAFWEQFLTWRKAQCVVAIQNLDLVALEGQILCLLGVNGSGKTTTLDLIGGLQKPTSGSININASGSQVGICPQRNVLWDELTVEEHVGIWNEIKLSVEDKGQLSLLVEACDLAPKKSARAGTLSGGQKRKLQLACTFVGGSTVCLLDEVTSGLDPLSRRIIWNIILTERTKRTMILTTHFLDEADILADNVIIISQGHLKCQGSTVELKSRFGGGYRVHLKDTATGPEMGFPSQKFQGETIYKTSNSAAVANLISELEKMRFSEIAINGPTMEDVFLKVAQEQQVIREGDSSALEESPEQDWPAGRSQLSEVQDHLASSKVTTFFQQVSILFRKRYTILQRNWWPYLLVLAMPLAVTPNLKTFLLFYKIPSCQDLTADIHTPEPFNFQLGNHPISELDYMLVGPESINGTFYNVVKTFSVGFGVDLQNYSNQFPLINDFMSFQQFIAANFTRLIPGALYMDTNTSAPTYAYVGDFGVFPALLMQNLWSQLRTGIPITGYFSLFNSLISPTAGNSIEYITYFCLAQAVYPALFALYPTYEKTRQVRALQYSNGVRVVPLWTSYLLFDFMFVLLISVACTVILSVQSPHWFAPAYMFPVLVLYGIAATLFAYVISLASRSQLGAFAYAAGIQAIMFLLSMMAFVLVVGFSDSADLTHAIDGTTFGLNVLFPIGNVVRAMLVGLNVFIVNCRDGQLVTHPGSIYAYGGPILYLCLQICFLFWLLLWLEGSHCFSFRRRTPTVDHSEDESSHVIQEVQREKQRVETSESDLLRVLRLSKTFGSNTAVDNISFGIVQGEILALLGPNGAGKSTIINMIRGELTPDDGIILVKGTDVVKHVRLSRRFLGVCPQFDALDRMTTREHVEFYARAKGIETIDRDVNLVLKRTGLLGYEDRLAAKLSGGNRRKLSLAIAILGNPPVLLLDEPSSSMDAASKRAMWKTLTEVTSGRSILLTTHSMEEADALATRAAIVSKRILALGTADYLRHKYGNVYHVHLVLKSTPTSGREEMDAVELWVRDNFPDARLDSFGNHHGQIKFSVPAVTPNEQPQGEISASEIVARTQKTRVGALFSLLEKNKDIIGLQFYSIRATTMDEVFLGVVKENNVREEGIIDNFVKRRSRWGWF